MEINGLKLNVLVEGEGEPVMLLHGFPDSNYVWRDVIPLLVKAGYKVIAPDQRGFGESDAPEGKAELISIFKMFDTFNPANNFKVPPLED